VAIEEDVIVIGGGIAGSIAALSAADTGAQVRLVTHKKSTLRHASGLIDVLGYTDGESGPVHDPFTSLDGLPEEHPYSLVGESAIRGGLEIFDTVTDGAYSGAHTDQNALVTTSGGAIKPTARYPTSAAAGLVSDDRSMLIVGFRSLTDFNGELVADHLAAAGVPFEVNGAEIEVPGNYRADARVTRIANALDLNKDLSYNGRTLPHGKHLQRQLNRISVRPIVSGFQHFSATITQTMFVLILSAPLALLCLKSQWGHRAILGFGWKTCCLMRLTTQGYGSVMGTRRLGTKPPQMETHSSQSQLTGVEERFRTMLSSSFLQPVG